MTKFIMSWWGLYRRVIGFFGNRIFRNMGHEQSSDGGAMVTQLITWNGVRARAEIARLLSPGIIGFHSHLEIIQLIATRDSDGVAINVLTVVVAEERDGEGFKNDGFLNPDRIKVRGLVGFAFGIVRYTCPVSDLIPALSNVENAGQWTLSGETLVTGKLIPIPPQFVPPDSSSVVPMNRILKNNFLNGSHVFEWADPDKITFKPLFDKPELLQKLSESVQEWVPLRLASLSDRIGSIVVQLPVTVLRSRFHKTAGAIVAEVAWHPKATARQLRTNCDLQFDNALWGYVSADVTMPVTTLQIPALHGAHQGVIWDDANGIVLAATGDILPINTVAYNIHIVDPEPRVFKIKKTSEPDKDVRLTLISSGIQGRVGSLTSDDIGGWTWKRMFDDELKRLMDERRFIRYLPEPGKTGEMHRVAVGHLRQLINQHGTEGAWLWDPYLSAFDLLETLFYCKHSGADLRGLSAGEEHSSQVAAEAPAGTNHAQDFITRQRRVLDETPSNFRGLRLEYRLKHGNAGWPFHDRFLIFPRNDSAALVWSLGTSVNGLGHKHHILQCVDNGELVKDAFVQLWDQLQGADYLVWRRP